MTLKDKRLYPYYLVAAVIIIMSVLTVVIVSTVRGHRNDNSSAPEITTEEPTLFMNGEVPYYADVPASAFSVSNFVTSDTGRISYNDKNVKYSTGIDVSSHQGEIDWDAVADDGIDFAIIRIGYRGYGSAGNLCEDDMAEINIKNAKDAGLKVGVYFYSQATTAEEAKAEADFVVNIIKNYNIEYPVVFDWENDPGVGMRTDGMTGEQLTECAVAFCKEIENSGYTPTVYFNLSDAYGRYDLSQINSYPFWYAQHKGGTPDFYYNYAMWQYTDCGSVNGINGNVDINISFKDFS